MNGSTPLTGKDSPAPRNRELERLCDEFEAQWRAGDTPRLEDYLARAPSQDRPAVLGDLLALELSYLADRGENRSPDEYRDRFVEYVTTVCAVFDRIKSKAPRNANTASPVAPTNDYRPTNVPGVVVAGRYTLINRIGEGGMGEVWVAKQSEPVKRKVALKLIKAGMDSRGVLARFEQERQALALMDHPHIAKVLDGGLTPDGHPFFVMELVSGLPLTKFCDDSKLTPRERLDLFVPICHAVQHAHHKGIVHRDLKPSNLLVTLHDGRAVPKVIDFGVAKATGGKLTDHTLSTEFGAVVGTLEYMSPEQAGFSGLDIDTRADIYSLGVILYELLTGLRPVDGRRLRQAALTEMIRILQEEEPSRPSTRLSTHESLPSLAALRKTEPRRLLAILRGELDWVVMKCLEKDRNRRYDTANGLARDIQRYLVNEPVEARPPSSRYRLGKFLRRNKGSVLAATSVLLALIGGMVATIWGLVRVEKARQAESREHQRAEANFIQAQQSIDRYVETVTNAQLLKDERFKPLLKDLLADARAFYQRLWEQQQSGEVITRRAELATNLTKVAAISGASGSKEEAKSAYRKAIEILIELPANLLDDDLAFRLAVSYHNLGVLELETGEAAAAMKSHGHAKRIAESLTAEHPENPRFATLLGVSFSQIANVQVQTSQFSAAVDSYRQAVVVQRRIAAQNPTVQELGSELAATYHSLGVAQLKMGDTTSTEDSYGRALAIREKLATDYPTNEQHQVELGQTYFNLGALEHDTGNDAGALERYREAISIFDRHATAHPTVTSHQNNLAECYFNLAVLHQSKGRADDAASSYDRAAAIFQRLVDENSSLVEYRRNLAGICSNLGGLRLNTGDGEAALASFRKAREMFEALVEEAPAMTDFQVNLAKMSNNIGVVEKTLGHVQAAERSYREAIEIQRPLAERNPEVTAFQSNLADSFNELGQLEQQGDLAAAADDYRATLDIYTRLVAQHPDVARFQNGVAGAMVNLAVIDQLEGRYAEAALRLKAAGPFHRAALAAGPDDSSYRTYFRNNRSNLVQVELALGHHASAAANILEWARYARDAIDTYDAACSTALCISLAQKDEALSGTDRHRTVMGYASQAIELLEKAINAGFHDAEQIAKNHYLDSLRDHDGFKKLIDSMKEPKPWEDCGVPARNMKDLSRVAGGLRGGAFIAAQTDTAELWDVATLGPRFRL